tara:strand:- start:6001 stop:8001 length:2001 start_codon:yes stop_codon:yes gene_type:complete
MANSDKDILITPNRGTANIPEISFVGQDNAPIKLRVLDDNTLSFEGNSGQLFSIDDNLTTGTIFAVSDISGVPSIQVDANGRIDIARYGGSLNIGNNNNTTDRALCVTGEIALTTINSTPAGLCFWESGDNTGTAPAQIYWDGPGYADNNNYLSLRTNSADRLTVTYAGAVGLGTNAPNKKFHLYGGHGDTSMRLTLPSGNNGAGTGDIHMQLWVSEPGRTWDGGGIGMNVTNYYTTSYPSSANDQSNNYFPQLNSAIGQAYLRFFPNGGRIEFSTMDNDGTSYREQIHMLKGGIGINTTTDVGSTYKLVVGGDINFTGELYQNGTIFETLPPQSAATIGAALRSDGTNAFWDIGDPWGGNGTDDLPHAVEDRYRVGFQISRGYAMAGYKNSTSYKNVCSLDMANNTITNHGDILTNGQGYCAGAQNLSMYAYVMIAVNGVGGTGSTVSKINMNTSSNANTTSINNNRSATSLMRRDFKYAYVYGGGDSRPDRFNLTNDTSALSPNGNPAGGENNPAGGFGATYGWTRRNGAYLFSWAAETYTAWPSSPGTDGSNKTLNARHGFNYWNTAGGYRTSSNLSKRSALTGSEATQVGKFECGEETFFTGMNRGYMCGMYDGAQKNTGAVLNYSAETFTADSNIDRQGPPGSASGAGAEFGTVLTGYDGV